jgi:outer membrane protein assembly factor BamB
VYVTGSDEETLLTICLDAASGRELWRRALRRSRSDAIYKANDPASPTPAADEHGVVAFFPDFGLAAYTSEGAPRWTLPLGPFKNFYGMAASPIVADGLIVLVCDQQRDSFIVAVDRATGRPRWKMARPGASVGWATPMIFRPSMTAAQVVVLGSTRLDAYDLATGTSQWWMPLGSMGSLGTPVSSGDTLLVSTLSTAEPWMPAFGAMLEKYDTDKDRQLSLGEFRSDPDLGEHFGWIDENADDRLNEAEWTVARNMGIADYGAIALKPGASRGQLDPATVAWRFKKNLPYVPAPLVYRDVFYLVRSGGIITSLDATTGRLLKEGRTRGALGDYYASPVAADGKVYLASSEGKMTVLEAAGDWQVLGVTDLGEDIFATPALSQGRIFVRTRGTLYCFGAT